MVARRLHTTPPHAVFLLPEVPQPTVTGNSIAALYQQDSPTPSKDNLPTGDVSAPTGPPTPAMKTPPTAKLTIHSDGFFLASFLDSWPERLVTDSTSHWTWDTLHKGFMEADAVYGTLNDNQWDLWRETATSIGNIRTTQVNFEHNINQSWMDTLARVDKNERVIQATLEKLSGSLESLVTTLAATTDRHDALLKEVSASVQKQGSQLEAQSGILRTITRHNKTRDAHLQTVEGDLVAVNGTVATFDARLQGLCTTTEATTSALRTNVNNVRARIISDLRRDLHNKLQESSLRSHSNSSGCQYRRTGGLSAYPHPSCRSPGCFVHIRSRA
jgi:hypothetical protein